MPKQDLLFQLIKTLSVEEKRQFAKIAKTNKNATIYEALFKAMDKQDAYNEDKLKKKYSSSTFVKNLSNRKNQLTDKLLDVLVGMNVGECIEAKIKHILSYLPILYQRHQFELMYKKIRKAKKIANESEQFYLLLELLEWEKKMVWNDTNGKYMQCVEGLIQEQELCLQKLNEQLVYRNLRRRLSILTRKEVMLEKQSNLVAFDALMENELLQENQDFLSFESEMHYNHIQIVYHRIKQDFELSTSYAQKLLDLCEERKAEYKDKYRQALHTYLTTFDAAKKFDTFPEVLEKLEILVKGKRSELYVLNHLNFYWLRYYIGKQMWKEALSVANRVETAWQGLSDYLKEGRYLAYCFNLMMLYWIVGDLPQTRNWLICIRNFSKAKSRKDDIFLASRLFELIVCYEAIEQGDNAIDFEKEIDATRKTLKNNQQYQDFHRIVVQHCRELNRLVDRKEQKTVIATLAKQLEGIQKEQPNLLCLEEILLWCYSKVKDVAIQKLY